MEILSKGTFNFIAPVQSTNIQQNAAEKLAKEEQSGVHVSLSSAAKDKQIAELKEAEKVSAEDKDFGAPLRNSKLNSPKTTQESLSPEEKLEQRIEEVKEKIKELQKEIQALNASSSEDAEEKLQMLNQQMQALLGELNSLMEQKIELAGKEYKG